MGVSRRVFMRAYVLIGTMALAFGGLTPAAAQQSNSPLYQSTPTVAPPSWPAWQGVHDGRAVWAPPSYIYIPPGRYPTDSRNLMLDNRAPNLWSTAPDLRDRSPHLGPPLESGAHGTGVRRPEGWRSPGMAEPGRPSRR
jgi:hypothetical protein